MKKFLAFLFCSLMVLNANANLVKSVDGGVISIVGTAAGRSVSIRMTKDGGRCYTSGSIDGRRFRLVVYRDAGNMYVNGNLPSLAAQLIEGFGYKPYGCSLFGMFR